MLGSIHLRAGALKVIRFSRQCARSYKAGMPVIKGGVLVLARNYCSKFRRKVACSLVQRWQTQTHKTKQVTMSPNYLFQWSWQWWDMNPNYFLRFENRYEVGASRCGAWQCFMSGLGLRFHEYWIGTGAIGTETAQARQIEIGWLFNISRILCKWLFIKLNGDWRFREFYASGCSWTYTEWNFKIFSLR
jgi:hypothetical protein